MKININKYFTIIWLVILVVYNSCVFIIVNEFANGYFLNPKFWVLYGSMMLAFILWFVLKMFNKKNNFGGLNQPVTFAMLYAWITFIFTTIMLFFVNKINIVAIIVPMILITGTLIVWLVLAFLNKQQIDNNKEESFNNLNIDVLADYFNYLANINKNFENALYDLSSLSENLVLYSKNNDIEQIDKRIIEYASFIEKNINLNQESNIYSNINKIKELLKERSTIVAKINNVNN